MRILSTPATRVAIAFLVGVLGASASHAQQTEPATEPRAARRVTDTTGTSATAGWLGRVSVIVRYDRFQPTGHSEFFTLVDRALSPGAGALHPQLIAGELRVGLGARWEFIAGGDAGKSTVASSSITRPASASSDSRQTTSLDLTNTEYLGASWLAWRWKNAVPTAPDRIRLHVGGGAGLMSYRLRQVGDFVDVQRDLVFHDDLRSSGRGRFAYLSAAAEVPLRSWIALDGELRRRAGSAPMTADYAGFDRIDLSGYSIGVGMRLRPFATNEQRRAARR